MSAFKRCLQTLFVVLGLSLVPTACVRLNEPDRFVCNNAEDCDSGEKCVSGWCYPKDFCFSRYDCQGARTYCENGACVQKECDIPTAAQDCNGYSCLEGTCQKTCFGSCGVGFHCDKLMCVAGEVRVNGQVCQADSECISTHCCSVDTTISLCKDSCQSDPISLPDCTTDAECGVGKICKDQSCVTAPTPTKKTAGESCQLDTDCETDLECVSKICRGSLAPFEACKIDADCLSGELCCTNPYNRAQRLCGELNLGCRGTIGDGCGQAADCIEGTCENWGCSKPCKQSSECGKSRWNTPNVCIVDVYGKGFCHASCKTIDDCTRVEAGFKCDVDSKTNVSFCE